MNGKNFVQRECSREFIPSEGYNYAPQKNEKNSAEDFSEDENFKDTCRAGIQRRKMSENF